VPTTTVDKALDILFHLLDAPAAVGVTAVGRSLGLPKASAHRLLASLRRRDLVEQDERGRYRPGIGLVALGLGALDRDPLVAAARPTLEREAEAIGETTFLVAPRAGRLRVLDEAEGAGFLRAAPRVGAEVPVHATAVGKLFLALSPEQVTLGDGAFERFTPRTAASRGELEAELSAIEAQGHATNEDEWIAGLSVVAAPVCVRGRLRGALAIAAATPRMRELEAGRVALRAIAAADEVGRRLAGARA
jgi:DNA-binding IclR family transcriptional regulator